MDTKAQRKAEKEARKQAERETREAERQRQENERQWAEFWASPVGQARAAPEAGDTLFQISLPVRDTRRTALAAMTHNMQTTTKDAADTVNCCPPSRRKGGPSYMPGSSSNSTARPAATRCSPQVNR